ncbi:MAG: DNA repair protein RecO [Bacteroidota bacterium]
MQQKLEGIILSSTKISDSVRIINIYTNLCGRKSCFLRSSSNKKSKHISNFIHALSIINFECDIRINREISYINEISLNYFYETITINPYKSSIAFFLAEIIDKTLREEEKNQEMYSFLTSQLVAFDQIKENISIFHLAFLVKYSKYLGIMPDIIYSGNNYLDQSQFFTQDQAYLIELFKNLNYNNISEIKITWQDRIVFLEKIILYYKIKFDIAEFKTHTILKEMFTQLSE